MQRQCELCGKPIAQGRLEVLPQTHRCVECARKNGSDFVTCRVAVGMDIETYKDLLRAIRN